jgi:hypothetical protein
MCMYVCVCVCARVCVCVRARPQCNMMHLYQVGAGCSVVPNLCVPAGWFDCDTPLRRFGSSRSRDAAVCRVHGLIRVRGEIMGPGKYENVGKSQSVLVMINPAYLPAVARTALREGRPAGDGAGVLPAGTGDRPVEGREPPTSGAVPRSSVPWAAARPAGRRGRRR